jgi:hypothetical protein
MLNNTGGVRIYAAPTLTNQPQSAAIQFFGTGSAFTGQAYIDSGAHDNAAVIFRTAGTGATIAERMRITSTGNVGIGTTSPTATLHITPNSSNYAFKIDQGASGHGILSYVNTTSSNQILLNATSNVNGLIVLGNGNVGIGAGTPLLKLDVRDGTGVSGSGGHVQIGAPDANADEKIIGFGDRGCGTVFTPSPCVSIGEQDADNRMVLRAAESFRFSGGNVLPDIDGPQLLGAPFNRWGAVYAINGTIQTSDARLKQGIANLKYGLSQVMQLRPVSFQWKQGNDKRTHLGLIAQEVDAVVPEAVQKGGDAATPLGMNYSDLIPVLIKAIQEQQGTLERAQAEIKTLRAENEALSRRIIGVEATSTQKAQ